MCMGIMKIYYTVIDLFKMFAKISIAIDTVSHATQTIIYSTTYITSVYFDAIYNAVIVLVGSINIYFL